MKSALPYCIIVVLTFFIIKEFKALALGVTDILLLWYIYLDEVVFLA